MINFMEFTEFVNEKLFVPRFKAKICSNGSYDFVQLDFHSYFTANFYSISYVEPVYCNGSAVQEKKMKKKLAWKATYLEPELPFYIFSECCKVLL